MATPARMKTLPPAINQRLFLCSVGAPRAAVPLIGSGAALLSLIGSAAALLSLVGSGTPHLGQGCASVLMLAPHSRQGLIAIRNNPPRLSHASIARVHHYVCESDCQ